MKKRRVVRKALSRVAVGTTVGAILAAGAAAYFFTQTKSGKAAAKKIKVTAAELSQDISERLSRAKKISRAKYDDIVEEVVDEYAAQRKVGKQTIKALKADLKNHWRVVHKELAKR